MLIQIIKTPKTSDEKEKIQLSTLGRLERQYLSRRVCALCEHRLDLPGCGVLFDDPCQEDIRIKRRNKCLSKYRPRKMNKHT